MVLLQVINAVLKDPEDRTQIALLYANQTPDDILLRQALDDLAAKHDNFKVWYTGAPSSLLLSYNSPLENVLRDKSRAPGAGRPRGKPTTSKSGAQVRRLALLAAPVCNEGVGAT